MVRHVLAFVPVLAVSSCAGKGLDKGSTSLLEQADPYGAEACAQHFSQVSVTTLPADEICRPGGDGRLVTEATSLLAALWGTRPTGICTYVAGDPGLTCNGQIPAGNAMYCPLDGTVSYDVQLIHNLKYEFSSFAAGAVIAHEWGHLNQHWAGLLPANPPYRYAIQNELHADCQAGLAMAIGGILPLGMTYEDTLTLFHAFCQYGDAVGTPWFEPNAHGTCELRDQAFQVGLDAGLQYASLLCAPTGYTHDGRPTGLNAMLAICQN
jgi:hypothetical protein